MDELPYDVKNSRRQNKTAAYTHHTVPAFKVLRDNVDVRIVGTLSPFEVPLPFDVTILGSTCWERIKELTGMLSGGPLTMDLKESPGGDKFLLPPWLFDYEAGDYAKRDRALSKFRVRDWNEAEKTEWFFPSMALASQLEAYRFGRENFFL